ncbi:polyphosphate polymerase domain-containing protein [Plebeiibacterium marinum]|uniref:Polyphosphate polymerase domain-containing protein n=1 Tax=Plebeiibacterium marinum TaxID=2992111 RepID=A0AAE3SIP1_9BACT|nr:polyphosphate polymerase domain-containing protein [Plebeiobacterium marinum]MCW3804905.1 polyphosphate polymerase domain-containing protein [Plebeiobacterium marinum]
MGAFNTNLFESIGLEDMDQVKLMNRIDKKYWFHSKQLSSTIESVANKYYLLNINGKSLLPYSTVYYDTIENEMYTAHHNGKLNRYKIRRRSYVSSGKSFFEVKFKNNKGRTIKKRVSSEFGVNSFSDRDKDFINESTPYSHHDLQSSLANNFYRLTLVNKNFKERCTIDVNLSFKSEDTNVVLNNLVIVEIKSDGRSKLSPLQKALRSQRIKTSGFSKYCIGRTVTDNDLKRNAFKGKVRQIEKVLNANNLYN